MRLETDIAPLSASRDKLLSLRGVEFSGKELVSLRAELSDRAEGKKHRAPQQRDSLP